MRATWRALSSPMLASAAVLLTLIAFVLPLRAQQTRDTTSRTTTQGTSGSATMSPNSICQPGDPSCGGDDTSPPSVSFTPSGGTFTSPTLGVTVLFEDNKSLYGGPSIYVNNTAISTYTLTSCGVSCEKATFGVTLQPGPNTVRASIRDNAGNMGSGSASYLYKNESIPPTIAFNPASGSNSYAATLPVTITWGDNQSLNASSHSITLNGTTVTGNFSYSGSATSATSSGTVSLQVGTNTLTAHVCDIVTNCTTTSATYTRYSLPTVSVTPNGTTVTVAELSNPTQHFKVASSGGAPSGVLYNLRVSCTGVAQSCRFGNGLQTDTVTVPQGDTADVSVPYSASAGGPDGTVNFTAKFAADTTIYGQGFVNVKVTNPCSNANNSSISPCHTSTEALTGTTYNVIYFGITANSSPDPSTAFGLTLSCSGQVTHCVRYPDSTSTTVVVKNDSTVSVGVAFNTAAVKGPGSITLQADDGAGVITGLWDVTVVAPPPAQPVYAASLSPHYQRVAAGRSSVITKQFQLLSSGTGPATYHYQFVCTGPAIASQCPAADSVASSPGVPAPIALSFTASATPGDTGSVALHVWTIPDSIGRDAAGNDSVIVLASDSTGRDSSLVTVTVARTTPGTDVASLNPGGTLDRSLCLTVAVAEDAAAECGDLRLAYALPGVRTLNTTRTPTLMYSSNAVHPSVLIDANVTLPDDGLIPDSVSARLLDTTGAVLATGHWTGSNWAARSARRIALTFNAANRSTGLYRYSLEVTRAYASTTSRDTVTGEYVVVNRTASPFGAGWWLAGLDRLYVLSDGSILWVGGDGSAQHFIVDSSTANTWRPSELLDHDESIMWDGTYYTDHLPHGVTVRFDALGRHVTTVDRLGHTTTFAYKSSTSDTLASITVPPASAGKTYVFHYGATGLLQSVDAPAVSGVRRFDSLTVAYQSGQRTMTVRRPDGVPTIFVSDSTSGHVLSRTDERGTVTSFFYNTAGLLTQATTALDSGKTITTTIRPQATQGLNGTAALPVDVAYTMVDGPRTDVGDSTLFWLDRFGAPAKIRNAVGDETVLHRDDPTWLARVTSMHYPSGQVLGAAYDSRGNLSTLTDSSTFRTSPLTYATTHYEWDPKWDFVTRTTLPEGDYTLAAYDTTNGNRLWQEDGRGSVSRVNFYYVTSGVAAGLLRAIQYPSGARDSLAYDQARGNLSASVTPLKQVTSYLTDDIGRVTMVTAPSDSAGILHVKQTFLNLLGQDTLTVDSAGSQALHMRQHFDLAGNVDSLQTSSHPDPNAIGTMTRVFAFDRANRKVAETLVGDRTLTWSYDPAGNVLVGGRRPTANTYDALNRLVQRMGDDTAQLVYDAMGHLRYANNSVARVSRSYNQNGTLAGDTLRIATTITKSLDIPSHDFTRHVYGLESGYDLDGRRTWLKHPESLAGTTADTAKYAYDPQFGALTTVTDVFGNEFAYHYDNDGRLVRLTRLANRPDSVPEALSYDADGRLVRRILTDPYLSDTLHNDSLVYDPADKITRNTITGETAAYSPFGHLLQATFLSTGGTEQFTYDAFGNQHTSWSYGGDGTQRRLTYLYEPGTGILLQSAPLNANPSWADSIHTDYSVTNGERRREDYIDPLSSCSGCTREQRSTVNFYSVEGYMTSSTYSLDTIPAPNEHYQRYSQEETYRYDALGRRVWQRMLRDSTCETHDRISGCRNELTRTVWDGDRILYELRTLGDTTGDTQESETYGPDKHYGQVGYTYGLGLDQPLELVKNGTLVVPFTTWRGTYDSGDCATSSPSAPSSVHCSTELFPVGTRAYGTQPLSTNPDGPTTWDGSLLLSGQDGSGYQYRRNRYYDPQTGRFTQEDPIGLAGGVNAYGFANGDPVSYMDPFGLRGCSWAHPEDCKIASLKLSFTAFGAKAKGQFFKLRGEIGATVGASTGMALTGKGWEPEVEASASASAKVKLGNASIGPSASCRASTASCEVSGPTGTLSAGDETSTVTATTNGAIGGEVTFEDVTLGAEVDFKGFGTIFGRGIYDGVMLAVQNFKAFAALLDRQAPVVQDQQ